MTAEVITDRFGYVDFSRYCREVAVPLEAERTKELEDVRLELFSEPTLAPLRYRFRFYGPEDLRLYLNSYDVTACLRKAIADRLVARRASDVRAEYLLGVDRYVEHVRQFIPIKVREELDFANTYSAMADWSRSVEKLGDQSIGWKGNLHVVNYLYRFIRIDAISLRDVWSDYVRNAEMNVPSSLHEFDGLTIVLSQGAAPFLGGSAPLFEPGGRLHFQLSYCFRNPLLARLNAIKSTLEEIAVRMGDMRKDYLDPLADGLARVDANFGVHTRSVTAAIGTLTDTVNQIGNA